MIVSLSVGEPLYETFNAGNCGNAVYDMFLVVEVSKCLQLHQSINYTAVLIKCCDCALNPSGSPVEEPLVQHLPKEECMQKELAAYEAQAESAKHIRHAHQKLAL